jgi:hypothetical protein
MSGARLICSVSVAITGRKVAEPGSPYLSPGISCEGLGTNQAADAASVLVG